MAGEVCRDARGGGAQVELGGRQRPLHRNVIGACGHHPGQQHEQGRGIAGGGEHFCLRHQLLQHIGGDGEIWRFLGGEVPVDGVWATPGAVSWPMESDGDQHQGATVPGVLCGREPRWEPAGRMTIENFGLT